MPGPHIVVIGLGAMGSAVLCQLARRGVRATGIEQFAIGHANGSSHGPTRMIRLAHFENSSYVPLLRRAYALWRELEAIAGQTLVVSTGIAEIGPPEGELIRGTLAAVAHYGLAHEVLDAKALMQLYPNFKLPEKFVAVLQPDGGYIEAAGAIEANIRIATAAGATVRTFETVAAIEPHATGVRITTGRDVIDADGAVVAAGPWMGKLLPQLRLPLRVTRQVVGWFEPADAEQFAADRFPVFILETQHGHHYGFPAYGRSGIKFAKHHHLQEAVDVDGYRRTVSAEDEAAIRGPLGDYLPAANGRLLDAQTCLYTMTPDDTFIIDRMPGYAHVVVASPCCGHGFKFSPVIGEILADLVTSGTTAHDLAPFRLQRFE
ncbi:MAG TPA: N-methyl-L-tryptophan oxidase [Xanthobacteraceae bacterium]|nr:N-methyl-L-tryptophan oxidase [Xanthobacteraceae bacterium]